jgi:hypothetical protein
LVGYTEGTITHCSAKSHVVGGSFTGGLAGYAAGRISNCFAWGDVTSANGGAKSGGLAGSCDADVTNSYAAGTVSGSVDAGGLIGSVGFGVAVRHCCWNRGRTNGLGAGTLDETCTAFALGDDITPILGTNNPLVWRHSSDIVLNDQHRMAIFQ